MLAQAAVDSKENEIIASRNVLEMFDITGMLVTVDALHCNAKTAQFIIDRGANHLIALKGNRPPMFAEVQHFFASP